MTAPTPSITTGLFLLLLQPDGRPEALGQYTGFGLAGALLADLTAAGRLDVTDDGARLIVHDTAPTGDELLDEGLRRFGPRDGRRLSGVLAAVGERLAYAVGDYLALQGVVEIEERAWLGLKPRRYPEADSTVEDRLRAGLVEVIRGAEPTVEQHALLGLVSALEVPTAVFRREETGLENRELKHRLEQLRETAGPAAAGVGRAVRRMHAAVMTGALASDAED